MLLTTFSQVGEMKAKETVLITGTCNLFYINKIKTIYFHKLWANSTSVITSLVTTKIIIVYWFSDKEFFNFLAAAGGTGQFAVCRLTRTLLIVHSRFMVWLCYIVTAHANGSEKGGNHWISLQQFENVGLWFSSLQWYYSLSFSLRKEFVGSQFQIQVPCRDLGYFQ